MSLGMRKGGKVWIIQRAKNWIEIICCPFNHVIALSIEFGFFIRVEVDILTFVWLVIKMITTRISVLVRAGVPPAMVPFIQNEICVDDQFVRALSILADAPQLRASLT